MKALYVKRVYIGYIVSSKQLKTAPLRVFYLLLRIGFVLEENLIATDWTTTQRNLIFL